MLSEKVRIVENPAMDLLNHIEDAISNYDYDRIIFRLNNGAIIIIDSNDFVGVNTNNPNFLEVHRNRELHFINLNNLAEVVVEYDNND